MCICKHSTDYVYTYFAQSKTNEKKNTGSGSLHEYIFKALDNLKHSNGNATNTQNAPFRLHGRNLHTTCK
jgi:hypothetical protein